VNFNTNNRGVGFIRDQRAICQGSEAPAYVVKSDHNLKCTSRIMTSSECKAAATAMDWHWDGDRSWSNRLPGCLLSWQDKHPQDVNFNTNTRGVGSVTDQRAICQAAYDVSSAHNLKCLKSILTSAECKAAAIAMGWAWDGDRNWNDRFHGCLLSPSDNPPQVNYNVNYMGIGSNTDQKPICPAGKGPDAFRLGNKAQASCPSGYEPIYDDKGCELASLILGKTYLPTLNVYGVDKWGAWCFWAAGHSGSGCDQKCSLVSNKKLTDDYYLLCKKAKEVR